MSKELSEVKKSKILTFLQENVGGILKNLFNTKEATEKKQFADVVVLNSSGEILLLQRSSNNKLKPDEWCLPGGHIDAGENPTEAGQRELMEETGLSLPCDFVKTIEREDCTTHYFQATKTDDLELMLLDNDEHFRCEFVPFENLDRYTLIFDLYDVLQDIREHLNITILPESFTMVTPEEGIANTPALISKAFDDGLISDNDFLIYQQITSSLETITKAFEANQISPEQYCNAIEKGKHFEFVKVVRDGKQFFQYREVGTNHLEDDMPTGDHFETGELGLKITKYSDKSFLITGATLPNLELLRDIKKEMGMGTWNKTLNGWCFPSSGKDIILSKLAAKMPDSTFEETIAKEAVIDLKNAVDVGTAIVVEGNKVEVTGHSIEDDGEFYYTVDPIPVIVSEKPKVDENTNSMMVTGDSTELAIKGYHEEKDLLQKKIVYCKNMVLEAMEAGENSAMREYAAIANEADDRIKEIDDILSDITKLNAPQPETAIGTLSPDGTKVKTADGWETVKKPKNKVKESEIGIPEADDDKGGELINNVNETNRVKTAKELLGKDENAKSVSEVIEAKGHDNQKPEIKEFDTRSGKVVSALDYGFIKPMDIMLVDQATVLDKPKPSWCPDINEKEFYGYKDQKFVFDYVKIADDKILLSLNGYGDSNASYFSVKNPGEARIKNTELKNDIANGIITRDDLKNVSRWGTPEKGYTITIKGKNYTYEGDNEAAKNDESAIHNNNECSYAVVNLDQIVAIQDYYTKRRKAIIEKEKQEATQTAILKIATWDQKKMDYYYPFSYERRLSVKQKAKYTPEQWEALSIDEKIQEVPFMKSPVVTLGKSHRIGQLDENKMKKSNFEMYGEFVKADYMKNDYHKSEHWSSKGYFHTEPCYIEYDEIRKALQWKKLDMKIQREENDGSYDKALETSYGDSNVKNDLFETHGVKIKLQNGKELKANHIEQIGSNLSEVYQSFGDRSSMSKNFGLKISHSGDKLMFARKALGIYIPSMKAIGVSDSQKEGKFGFTLAHEFAHFMDNYAGKQIGRHYASEGYGSTASKIANVFRHNMNQASDSDYMNRTCECFARALEQYHAMKHQGEDAIKYKSQGIPYHEDPNHPSKENFNNLVKPLIEQFLKENDHVLKSAFDELNIVDINNNFEIIKSGFDAGAVTEDKFLEYADKYNEIVKGDPSHGGKLVKKTITDKAGKKEVKWVSKEQAAKEHEESKPLEFTKHSHGILGAFAKETPEAELKKIINSSHDPKLRKAAHAELDRRGKMEKPQEKKDEVKKKPSKVADTKKKDEPKDTTVKLYHGSDQKFDKFDKDKMGSGEGSDLFGAGFYLTDNKDVADFYAHHTAKKKHIESYTDDGIFGSPVPKYAKDADEKASKNKHINEFDVEGKILDASTFIIDAEFKKHLGEISEKHFGDKESALRSIDYIQSNKAKVKNYRGELPYIIQHVGMGDSEVVKDIMKYVKSAGYDGVKYGADKSFEGNKDSNNYFIFNEKAIKHKEK